MEKLSFGLIGCGFIGGTHAEILSSLPQAELAAVSDLSEEKGVMLAEKYGCGYYKDYEELLRDPKIQAVAICLPSGLHSRIAGKAAEAGKHVMCEKPIDTEVDSAQRMVDACKKNGVKLGVIMQHRFDKPILLLKHAIADGRLGAPLWAASRTLWYRDEAYYSNPWRGTWKGDGGGALINQSIHYIDLLLYFMGDVKSVSAKCRTLFHRQIETEDTGIANLEFESGALGAIEGTTAAYPGLYTELSLFCENGTAAIRNDELLFYRLKSGEDKEFEGLLNPEKANRFNQSPEISDASHRRQYEDFIDSVLSCREPSVTGEEALKSLKVIKSIYRASQEKKEISL